MAAAGIIALDLTVTLLAGSQEQRIFFADVVAPAVELLVLAALAAAALRSFRLSKRLGLAWTLIGLSIAAFAAGDIIWAVLELGLNEPPFPSLADLFYLLYYPLLLSGVLLLQKRHSSRLERSKRLLDMGVVMLAGILGFWNFLLGLMLQTNAGSP